MAEIDAEEEEEFAQAEAELVSINDAKEATPSQVGEGQSSERKRDARTARTSINGNIPKFASKF